MNVQFRVSYLYCEKNYVVISVLQINNDILNGSSYDCTILDK